MSFTYAGCGVEYATKFSVTLPPLAAEPLAAAEAGADEAAAEAAGADDADVVAAADEAGVDDADDAVDFLELQPAANTRPDTATVTMNLFSGRTVVLQVVYGKALSSCKLWNR
ncbi:MAG TPA: hypothetical protein VK662_01455 [Acidothermaceae bacterium]|nr:hypothetical protein [Acidothermaceae bacterium]